MIGLPQPGIFALGTSAHEFLEFDLDRLSAEEINLLRTEHGDLLRAEATRRGIVPPPGEVR